MRNGPDNIVRRLLLTLLLDLAATFSLFSGVPDRFLKFYNLTIEDGLSSQLITSIVQDGEGLCWLASTKGLNSFDGHSVRVFKHIEGDPLSLPDDGISKVFADSEGTLWVSTGAGLCRMASYAKFTTISYEGRTLYVKFFADCPGGVLLFSGDSVLRYDFETGAVEVFCSDIGSSISDIFQDSDGSVLINDAENGVSRLDVESARLEKVIPQQDYRISGGFVMDSHRNIWAALYEGGLVCYSLNDGIYSVRKIYTATNSALSNNFVTSILEHNGKIWIATDGGGINVLDQETDDFTIYTYRPDNPSGIQSKSFCLLYESPDGTVWAGTVRDGVIGIRSMPVRTVRSAPPDSHNGLSSVTVLSMLKDDSGIVWVGTDGGGLNSYDLQTGRCEWWPSTSDLKITSITTLGPDRLLLGCYFDGAKVFEKKSGRISEFRLEDPEVEQLFYDSYVITTVHQVSDEKLWLFLGDDFYRCSIKDRHCSFISNLGSGTAVHILNHSARYTVVSKNGKILEIDNENESIKCLYEQEKAILSADVDKSGRIWITDADGLKSYLPGNRDVQKMEFPSFIEPSLVKIDAAGRLWVCSRNGIARYDFSSDRFRVFDKSDGVSGIFYAERPSVLTDWGILFGSDNGMVEIDRDAVDAPAPDPVRHFSLRTVKVNGSEVTVTRKGENDFIRVPRNFGQLTIEFNLIKSNIFDDHQVMFHLNGSHRTVDVPSDDGKLSLNSLPTGFYSVSATCLSPSGEPYQISSDGIGVKVQMPALLSPPVLLCYVILLTFLIACIVRFQNYRKSMAYAKMMDENQKMQEREKVNFLVNLSHELRTPLTLVNAPLDRILSDRSLPANLLDQLERVRCQTDKMTGILNLSLEMNSLENGGFAIQSKDVDFNEWVRGKVEEFRLTFASRGLTAETVPDLSIGILKIDVTKCDIVLSNFLMNACKYSHPSTVVRVETKMNLDSTVSVLVYNSGDGFKGTDPERLFEKFFKLDETSSGFGLGLAYSKSLVLLMNGSIGAKDLGDETLFWFTVPAIASSHPQVEESSELESVSSDFDTSTLDVLIVDDQKELVEMIREYLGPEFRFIDTAGDGQEALEHLEQRCPDIIVSDVMMPRLGGYDLCRTIKTDIRYSHIPIILLTARADKESREIGYKVGADAYVAKPFGIEQLLVVIKNILRARNELRRRLMSDSVTMVDSGTDTFSIADEQFISKLNEYIESHISDPDISVSDIARHLALSRTLLYNKFHSITGQGVMSYIGKIRMERAARQIIETDCPISEIAMSVGFTDNAYFSTVFKKVYGKTPSAYRANAKNNNQNTDI